MTATATPDTRPLPELVACRICSGENCCPLYLTDRDGFVCATCYEAPGVSAGAYDTLVSF